jgi:hypothetical protein
MALDLLVLPKADQLPPFASARSTGSGPVQADASALGGAGYSYHPGFAGAASASASAQSHSGEAMTTASAPAAGPRGTSALYNAAIGPGSEWLVPIGTAEAVSNAILTPKGPDIGVGAMSAASEGNESTQAYEATAVFDFSTTARSEALDLNLLADNFAHSGGFDKLELQVVVDGTTRENITLYGLTGSKGAEAFFQNRSLSLVAIAPGSHSVKFDYVLDYPSYTYGGFGFTYDLATAPVAEALTPAAFDLAATPTSTVPEPSTWAMMLIGFGGLAFASYRASGGTRGRRRRPIFGRHFRWAI